MKNFLEHTKLRRNEFEKFLETHIYPDFKKKFHPILAESCIYSLEAGGKRIRPILAIESYLSSNEIKYKEEIFYLAASLECIHTYSLIHDDLPSMDNDDYRRGILTNHKKFSESTAILAGDALNSFSFYLLSRFKEECSDLLEILHKGAGGEGMVSGQIEDILMENNQNNFSDKNLESVHEKKTGALILSSLLLGNRLASNFQDKENFFMEYGKALGLLFQISDDVLDFEGSFEEIGKTPKKDLETNKLTYVNLYGIEKAKNIKFQIANELSEKGKKISSFFQLLPIYISERKN